MSQEAVVYNYGHEITPITQEPVMNQVPATTFNVEDPMSVQTFFKGIADTVVDASELAKTVAALRKDVEGIQAEVAALREQNRRMDQEIAELRQQRDEARAEAAGLKRDLDAIGHEHSALVDTHNKLGQEHVELASIKDQYIGLYDEARKARDDAQYKVAEQEETIARLQRESDDWQAKANECGAKLATLKSIFQG